MHYYRTHSASFTISVHILRYYWCMINCIYLNHTTEWISEYVYTCESIAKPKKKNISVPSKVSFGAIVTHRVLPHSHSPRHWSVFCHSGCICIFRIVFKWNHTVWPPVFLTTSTQHNYFEMHKFVGCICSSFLSLLVIFCCVNIQ